MFPAMCRKPPCMNIEVKSVTHQAAWSIGIGRGIRVLLGRCATACVVVLGAGTNDPRLELPL